MSRRTRRVVVLVALCVAASTALGVGGYSSASVERNVSLNVVSDEQAYLGTSDELHCGRSALFYNRFSAPVTDGHVDVTVGDGGKLVVKRDDGFVQYSAGQEFTIDIDDGEEITAGKQFKIHLKPTTDSADSITADIEASGPGFSVSTTSEPAVSCEKSVRQSNGGVSDDDNDDEGSD